jgi:hypothetical protein
MIPKVLTLTTGDQIICGITELKNEQDEGICFLIAHPYILQLIPSDQKNEVGQPASFNVNYVRWMSCSSDTQFRLPYNSVMALGEPEAEILETYMNKFGDLFNDDTNTVSASDSTDSSEESGLSDSGD